MKQMEPEPEIVEEPEPEVVEEPVVVEDGDGLAHRLHEMVTDFQPIDSGDLNSLVANQPNLAAQVIKKWNRSSA